jgi:hypothetical protein
VDVAAHGVTEGTFVPNIAGVAAVVTEQLKPKHHSQESDKKGLSIVVEYLARVQIDIDINRPRLKA